MGVTRNLLLDTFAKCAGDACVKGAEVIHSYSPTKQMRSAYCLRGRFYGRFASILEHQIRSAFVPHYGVLAIYYLTPLAPKAPSALRSYSLRYVRKYYKYHKGQFRFL